MDTWPVQDAKARFSEFLQACISHGPQLVTKHGAEAAVLVPVALMAAASRRGTPVAQTAAAGSCGAR